jgi:aspartate racemase
MIDIEFKSYKLIKNYDRILGGMGTQAGRDFCNKLAVLNRGKIDQEYPLFLLYNKSNIGGRPESIGSQTKNLCNTCTNKSSKIKFERVLKSLLKGCKLLEKNKCKFIVIPGNTAHYWYDDMQKKINVPIINMPKEVFKFTKKNCKKNSKVGLLATEGTLKSGVYNNFFDENYNLLKPFESIQKNSVNKAIKFVKMGNVRGGEKAIKPAINYLMSMKCKKIILGCTELPIAIFAFKSFKNIKSSKIFLDLNLILAEAAMAKHKN